MESSFEPFEIDFSELERQNHGCNSFYTAVDYDSCGKAFNSSQNCLNEVKNIEQNLKNLVNNHTIQPVNASPDFQTYRKSGSVEQLSFTLSPSMMNATGLFNDNFASTTEDSNCSFRFNVESLPWENEEDKLNFREDRNQKSKRCSNYPSFDEDLCDFDCSPILSSKKPCVSSLADADGQDVVYSFQDPIASINPSLDALDSISSMKDSNPLACDEIVELTPPKQVDQSKDKKSSNFSSCSVPQHRRPFDPCLHCGVVKDGVLCRRSILCKVGILFFT
ncbi:hypothetical protein Ciccas_006698 [Cichlidogyrus casuarinus]|uniref:Uncharacterized protein n=1 Tax=Cichlidogyrus casuarinus TaxID=1844966 RepID=A0ABD2Q7G2_9PLAT